MTMDKFVTRENVIASGKPYFEDGRWTGLVDLFVGLTAERCLQLGDPVAEDEDPVAFKQVQEGAADFVPLYDRTLDVPINKLRRYEIVTTDGS